MISIATFSKTAINQSINQHFKEAKAVKTTAWSTFVELKQNSLT